MPKSVKIILTVVIVLIALGGGVFLYLTRPAAAPTQDVSSAAGGVPSLQNTSGTVNSSAVTYSIIPVKSLATFTLTEVLNGHPNTVIGTTTQIGGQFALNMASPFNSTVGSIKVDARTFKTDNSERDGVIASSILKSDDPANEFITYVPSSLSGMPATITQGVPFSFELDGDITIAGTDGDATWTGTATLTAPGELTINASTTVARSDFGLTIPNIPFVANVSQNVTLSVHAVAVAVQ